jgi:FAD synthase
MEQHLNQYAFVLNLLSGFLLQVQRISTEAVRKSLKKAHQALAEEVLGHR